MKRLLATLLTILTIGSCIGVNVFSDTYVPSIAVRKDVILVSNPKLEHKDGCVDEIELCTYLQKDEIRSEFSRQQLEIAYQSIIKAKLVTDLNPDIEQIANALSVNKEDLVVRDLFDITEYEYHVSKDHNINEHIHNLSLEIETQTLENFVCLLVYYDDAWHVIEDLEVLKQENRIDFRTDELSPFALVVATDYKYVPAVKSDEIIHILMFIVIIITFVLAQFIRLNKNDTLQIQKRNVLIRDIMCLISLLSCIILYFFGNCDKDIYILVASVVVNIIVLLYSHPIKKHER